MYNTAELLVVAQEHGLKIRTGGHEDLQPQSRQNDDWSLYDKYSAVPYRCK